MSYSDTVKKYLSHYKSEKFSAVKNGYFRGKEYCHILAKDFCQLNLIDSYGSEFWESNLRKEVKLHQCFHHLNSSQAMCINFFFPLFKEKKLELILQALNLDNGEKVNYDTVKFEKEAEIDKIGIQTPTSFDFYFETDSGRKMYFEIKYTENGFAKAKQDNKHKEIYKDKYNQIYKDAANGKIISTHNNESDFLNHYQIMRNLIHVGNDSYVIFVVPKENKSVYSAAEKAKDFVEDKYKDNVKVLTWDCLYELIEEQNFTGSLKTHFDEFKKKYILQ
jgi:hypothetical protein